MAQDQPEIRILISIEIHRAQLSVYSKVRNRIQQEVPLVDQSNVFRSV